MNNLLTNALEACEKINEKDEDSTEAQSVC